MNVESALEQLRVEIENEVRAGILGRLNGMPIQVAAPKKARKKPPKQFCPVRGCKGVAAPVFGMVCSKHKDLPKASIRKYRAARKAAKAKKS